MFLKYKILLLSILLGLLVGFVDTVFDSSVFSSGDFLDRMFLNIPEHELFSRVIILLIFMGFGWSLAVTVPELSEVHRKNRELADELRGTLANMKKLSGLLPICAACKKIRDDQGYWNQIESYIEEHSEAAFTHGICPECADKYYPESDKEEHQGG